MNLWALFAHLILLIYLVIYVYILETLLVTGGGGMSTTDDGEIRTGIFIKCDFTAALEHQQLLYYDLTART